MVQSRIIAVRLHEIDLAVESLKVTAREFVQFKQKAEDRIIKLRREERKLRSVLKARRLK